MTTSALADRAGAVAATPSAAGNAADLDTLDAVESEYLKRRLSDVKKSIKDAEPAERPLVGQALGTATEQLRAAIEARRVELVAAADARSAERDAVDLTALGRDYRRGHLHPLTQAWRELEDIFLGLGYEVHYGPEVEDDWHNFEALNFPPGHPARAMHDTLYVDLHGREPGDQFLLRTHTSPVQIRLMEAHDLPIYAVVPGRTFRRDTLDARHSPVFHQIEALVVDRGITMGHLMGTIEVFFQALFGPDVEARFFPFTEPSAELITSCPFCAKAGCRVCSNVGWIEMGGCGMVDPNVLVACGIDPEEYSGFALGFGIDRIPLLRHQVPDLKTLLWDNDLRFLGQF
jgi:phenylalanyl-tRNA synthetase alpha chain